MFIMLFGFDANLESRINSVNSISDSVLAKFYIEIAFGSASHLAFQHTS